MKYISKRVDLKKLISNSSHIWLASRSRNMRGLKLSDLLIGFDPTKRKTYKYLVTHLEQAIKNAKGNLSEEEQKKARSLAKCLHDRVTSKSWNKKSWPAFTSDPAQSQWLHRVVLEVDDDAPDSEDEVPAVAPQEDNQVAASPQGRGRSTSSGGGEPADSQPVEYNM